MTRVSSSERSTSGWCGWTGSEAMSQVSMCEPGHERLLRSVHLAGARERGEDRDRPRDQQRERGNGDRRPAIREQPIECEDRPEDKEDAELDDFDDILGAGLEALPDIRPPDAERYGRHEHRNEPVALGREHRQAI